MVLIFMKSSNIKCNYWGGKGLVHMKYQLPKHQFIYCLAFYHDLFVRFTIALLKVRHVKLLENVVIDTKTGEIPRFSTPNSIPKANQ